MNARNSLARKPDAESKDRKADLKAQPPLTEKSANLMNITFSRRCVGEKGGPGIWYVVDAFRKSGANVKENGESVEVVVDLGNHNQKETYRRYSLGDLKKSEPFTPEHGEGWLVGG